MDKISTTSGMDAGLVRMTSGQDGAANQAKALNSPGVKSAAQIDKAASGFEALLLHQMLSAMSSTVESSGMFNEDSNQAQIYRDMLNQAISDSVVKGKGIGVKEFLRKELSKSTKTS